MRFGDPRGILRLRLLGVRRLDLASLALGISNLHDLILDLILYHLLKLLALVLHLLSLALRRRLDPVSVLPLAHLRMGILWYVFNWELCEQGLFKRPYKALILGTQNIPSVRDRMREIELLG